MTDLAKLVVKLEAQTAQYQAGLERAEKRLAKFDKQSSISAERIGKGLGLALSKAASAFAVMGKLAIDNADRIAKMSQSTGVSVESLSQLEYAAKLSGTSLDGLAVGLKSLSRNAVEAARGATTQARAFDALGVSVKNTDGTMRDSEQIMLDVAERFAKMEDGAAKASLAQEIFGKSGMALIPLLNQGRDGIEALRTEADQLGATLDSRTAKAAERFNDNLTRINTATRGLVNRLLDQMLPAMVSMTDRFIESAKAGGALDFAVKALAGAFKVLVSAGVIVTSVFQQLGRIVYGVGAAIVRIARGEFSLAADEITHAFRDARNNVTNDMETIAQVWSDKVPEFESIARGIDDALGDSLIFNDERAAAAADRSAEAALRSIKSMAQGARQQADTFGMAEDAIIRYRVAHGDLADAIKQAGAASEPYIAELIEMTDRMMALREEAAKSAQQQREYDAAVNEGKRIIESVRTPLEVYSDSVERLNELLEMGVIDQESYYRAIAKAQDAFDEATKVHNKFLEQANRNTQDILAGGIRSAMRDGFSEGAKGALNAFMDMLERMVAEALAANVAGMIFGGEGMGSGGGWVGAIASAFGGSRDRGGRGRAGVRYLIGTGAQPEEFVPDTPGTFYPAGSRGSTTVNQSIHVTGRVDGRSARQLEIEAARRQRIAMVRLG